MGEVTQAPGDHSSQRARRAVVRLLQASCVVSTLACAGLLVGTIASLAVDDRAVLHALRTGLLGSGMTLLALALAASAFAASRLSDGTDSDDLRRLRERLYFVLVASVLVLLPSALLGLRWAAAARPVTGAGVMGVVEVLAQAMVTLLLARNARDALRLPADDAS
ncbi:MAG: hypothetical protein J0H00_01970 [Burkholderiales bacterium]|nr:hypothetical protein [Burkholderiales bacterium]OJX07460.1 MAG: hypothetical protein BGO72_08375 [Burkholderiales bacterium 70-64]